ncbi:MAG: type I phosphomannose isomerase catalytic subunit [Deltaproteobacteria bacterium]|nr:type I phosphomannose isomerase catalytic subunit [Deltaproteobacteria bacterium]
MLQWLSPDSEDFVQRISILKNTIQPYAWGSHSAIAELLGTRAEPDTPQAELWMGAHPQAPSQVAVDGKWVSLKNAYRTVSARMLGAQNSCHVSQRAAVFLQGPGGRPAALTQAHPRAYSGPAGFERENGQGLVLDAPQRNYRDPNHKPECICALTPFWALHGFRKIPEILALGNRLGLAAFEDLLKVLRDRPVQRASDRFSRPR